MKKSTGHEPGRPRPPPRDIPYIYIRARTHARARAYHHRPAAQPPATAARGRAGKPRCKPFSPATAFSEKRHGVRARTPWRSRPDVTASEEKRPNVFFGFSPTFTRAVGSVNEINVMFAPKRHGVPARSSEGGGGKAGLGCKGNSKRREFFSRRGEKFPRIFCKGKNNFH